MQIEKSDYQIEPSDFKDLGPEFLANRAVVSEQISEIKAALLRYDERMTRIETELKATAHIKTNQDQLRLHDTRMTRIESEVKSLIKWWIGVTGTISGAIIGLAKLLSP